MNNGKKILIIEDEQILGDILLNKLYGDGFNAQWELDGEAGLSRMREFKPDLVLLDILMPKKDGYEVLQTMRDDPELSSIPVVVISNSGQPVEIERILELGARDYIIKAQFSPEEVLEKVRKYLDKDSGPKEGNQESSQKDKSHIKIIVVEDDSFLSGLSVSRLQKEGYTVLSAVDGEQALKMVEENKPDLMLLDIIMPGINGFEVLRSLRANPEYKDMAIIIFSNLGQDHEIEEGKKLGADDFLIKAKFTLKEVVEKISTLLKRKGKI